jgi:alpha/beta hydrolase fold
MIRGVAVRRQQPANHLIFDRSGRVPAPSWRDLAANIGALVQDLTRFSGRAPVPPDLPRGDGHAVLVIPALFSSDYLTRGFRGALATLGYRVEGWEACINFGPTQPAWDTAAQHLADIAAGSGQRVSLVGHSLGGVLARALATEYPEQLRCVITVSSPFRLPTASRIEPLYRMLSPWHVDDSTLISQLADPPPVPTTAIYSPRDGIVAWTSCIDKPGSGRENVAIDGPHSTMLANPATIRIVADRLARPDPAAPSDPGRAQGT